jgi:hypothetical protein
MAHGTKVRIRPTCSCLGVKFLEPNEQLECCYLTPTSLAFFGKYFY